MAGKPRKRIDYAGWSVDIFSNDPKIDKLLDAQGWIGFGIYFYLCQMAFGGEGYFYEWCYDLCATTARKMGGGVSAGTVKETVDYCLQIGLFDKGLFDRWGVLTSRGIQKSYLIVLKSKNRKGTEIIKEYWLLDISEERDYQGVVFVHKNCQLIGENDNSLRENDYLLRENDHSLEQKESKVKKSKVNNNSFVESPTERSTVVFDSDSFEIRCVDILIESCLKSFPNSKVPRTLSEKQKWAIEIDRMKRLDGRSELDIMKALNFAVKDTFWQTNIRSTKKFREKFETLIIRSASGSDPNCKVRFNNFKQREYDMGALEKELLGYGLSNMNETNHEKGD